MASMSKKASKKQVNKDASALPPGGDVDHVDNTDDEMFPEDRPHSSLPSREKRRRERDVKAKPKEMTEEEMMDLALRLSEQEATMAAVKRQQEDEAMKEALKESMFSQTQPCASPQSYYGNRDPSPKLPSRRKLAYPAVACEDVVLVEDLNTETNGEPNPRGAGNHKHGKRKRKREDGGPLLEQPDLSQTEKIYSDSLTLDSQPNGVNHGDEESESMCGGHVGKHTTATTAGKERQTKSDEDSLPESMKITRDTNSRWSDDGKDLVWSKKSPSPVFGEERRLQLAGDQRQSPGSSVWPGTSGHSPKCLRLSRLLPLEMGGSDTTATTCLQYPQSSAGPSHTQQLCVCPEWPRGQPLVHYYWGVPFCPHGLDPDEYTQAILAQMEVYEKSLKHAQRSLLKKAQWGDGIIPKTEVAHQLPGSQKSTMFA
ncbi:hypothetical protein CRUP_020604 [Coryphaenoides rupestris]|nr:hypothetical protein CRUP_020604 [Coryphaenoides rupestris]